jgi:two-component system repressor protein LuxO
MSKTPFIYLIEDEPDIVALYKSAFEMVGYEVDSVLTGEKALAGLNEIAKNKAPKIPDIIVLDFLLPDVSGFNVLSDIRKIPAFDNTFIFILTNYVSENLCKSIKKMPKVEYFIKFETPPNKLIEYIKEKIG